MLFPSPMSDKCLPTPTPANKPHLLIVSDSSERLTRLRALLALGEVEITSATSPEELNCACRSRQDLVVVDASPARLGGVLKALRKCAGCAEVPVLVEANRLAADPDLAGLLPKYRAMPCGHSDLVTLVRLRIAPRTEERKTRRML